VKFFTNLFLPFVFHNGQKWRLNVKNIIWSMAECINHEQYRSHTNMCKLIEHLKTKHVVSEYKYATPNDGLSMHIICQLAILNKDKVQGYRP